MKASNTHYFPGSATGSATKSLSVAYSTAATNRLGPFSANVMVARFLATTDCFIRFGSSTVTGTTSSGLRLVGNIPEYLSIKADSAAARYVAVMRASSSGTLYVNEMTQ